MIDVRMDDTKDLKLKDYLEDAIREISDDYVEISHNETINVVDTLEYIRKYRNILLCIDNICKTRKKY
ncbi:MAG: hypothetical protein IKT40_14385 [Bacilli bacterium]|nr:hypothetical protein [Bacilli bacterium]